MAFQNQNNKKDYGNNESVNTRGFQFFNREGIEGSTMLIGLWNQLITIKIHPAKEQSKQTETSVFDYDKTVNIVLAPANAILIGKGLEERFIPKLKNGEDYSIGFSVGSNSVISFSTGVKQTGKVTPFMAILRNLNPSTYQPEEALSYTFNQFITLDEYEIGMKDGFNVIKSYGELELLAAILQSAPVELLGVDNHARRVIEKKFNDNVFKLYKDISAKIGGSFYSSNNNYGGSYSGGFVAWGGETSQPQTNNNSHQAEVSEVSSIEDLDSFV